MADWLDELKRRKVVRAVLAWAAAAFIGLQVADLTFEPLGFPDWAYRFVVMLSAIGLPVTAVVAWFFDLRTGKLQRDLDVAGPGETPTGRTSPIVALVVIAATLGLAGGLTFVSGARSGSGAAVNGPVDADLIAVAPFRVVSSDPALAYLREGAVDLLSNKLRDVPRVVDPRTAFTAWQDRAGTMDADLPQDDAVAWAAGVGAGRVLLGSVVGSPDRLTLSASLLEVPGGGLVAQTSLESPADSLMAMIDGLAGRLLGVQAGAPVSRVTSLSLDAVRHYLDGRTESRSGDFGRAAEAYARAVDEDSTFAAAALGAVTSNSMLFQPGDTDRARRLAWEFRDRLTEEDRAILRSILGHAYPDPSPLLDQIEYHQQVVGRFPHRMEAWYELGDDLFHGGNQTSITNDLLRAAEAFERALQIDSTFYSGRLHLAWTWQALGDERWRQMTPVDPGADPRTLGRIWGVNLAPSETQRSVVLGLTQDEMQELPSSDLLGLASETWAFFVSTDRVGDMVPAAERIYRVLESRALPPADAEILNQMRYTGLMNQRRWAEARAFAEQRAGTGTDGTGLEYAVRMLEGPLLWGAPDSPAAPASVDALEEWWGGASSDMTDLDELGVRAACVLALASGAEGGPMAPEAMAGDLDPSGDPQDVRHDPILSSRRTCALMLRALAEHASGPEGGERPALESLRSWLGIGPLGVRLRLMANLTAARIFNELGDRNRALDHARRYNRSTPVFVQVYQRPLMEEELRAVEGRGEDLGARTLRRRLAAFAWPRPDTQ